MNRYAVITFFALVFLGFAPAEASNEDKITSFHSTDNSLVFLEFTTNAKCGKSKLTFTEVTTKNTFTLKKLGSKPRFESVAPGTYVITSGECGSPYSGNKKHAVLTDLSSWFGPIEIEANKVIDLGKFNFELVEKKAINSSGKMLVGLSQSLGVKERANFFFYSFENSERLDKFISKKYPELSNKIEKAVFERKVDDDKYRELIDLAFAKNPDGSYPIKSEALKKLYASMTLNSIALNR